MENNLTNLQRIKIYTNESVQVAIAEGKKGSWVNIQIEVAPELLFKQPVALLARQHYICTEEKERHIVDLVFLDSEADELILVELKRGKLTGEHYNQIRRYLNNAHKSQLLRSFLEKGTAIRGILATIEEGKFKPKDAGVSVCIVDKKQTIEVLKQLRNRRLENRAGRL